MVHAREGKPLPSGVKLRLLEGRVCNIPQRLNVGVLGEIEPVKLRRLEL
jgi:hypothetical protein